MSGAGYWILRTGCTESSRGAPENGNWDGSGRSGRSQNERAVIRRSVQNGVTRDAVTRRGSPMYAIVSPVRYCRETR